MDYLTWAGINYFGGIVISRQSISQSAMNIFLGVDGQKRVKSQGDQGLRGSIIKGIKCQEDQRSSGSRVEGIKEIKCQGDEGSRGSRIRGIAG